MGRNPLIHILEKEAIMKIQSVWLTLSLSLLFLIFGSGIAAAGKINIDVNCTMKPGGAEEASIKKFKEILDKESNGRLNVKMFMSGQLGKEKAVLELLKLGQTQMALTGGTFLNWYAKEYDPITIPFFLPTWECVKAYLEGSSGDKIRSLAEEKGGLVWFSSQKRAPRHMTSNRKIEKVEDLNWLKIRMPAIPIWVDVWKELGTLPTVIPAGEIYLAMKTGQVEAHENSLVSPYSRKLWEVQKYIILTGHIYFPWHWVASKVWFDKLDAADQALIRKAAISAGEYGTSIEDEKDAFYVEELKKKGMVFITPDNKAIQAKAMPAIKRALSKLNPEVAKEVERVCK
jgi:tripartite ATP-independent transporter DctP family solute receptor